MTEDEKRVWGAYCKIRDEVNKNFGKIVRFAEGLYGTQTRLPVYFHLPKTETDIYENRICFPGNVYAGSTDKHCFLFISLSDPDAQTFFRDTWEQAVKAGYTASELAERIRAAYEEFHEFSDCSAGMNPGASSR